MSQLLGRIGKISKQRVRCLCESRSFSSTAATPYLLLSGSNEKTASGENVIDLNLYDPRKDEKVKIRDPTVSNELKCLVNRGSSRGWVVGRKYMDSTLAPLHLTNIFNPCASVSSHKVLTLPPLDDSKAHVASISLSASPNEQDCVVAAKSCSPFISLCRPGDSDWTHIKVPFFASKVTYSVRDSKFYLHWGEKPQCDLIEANSGFPEVSLYPSFPNSDIPQSRQDQVLSSIKTEFLVESPSGDSFIVYWCNEYAKLEEGEAEWWCSGKTPPPKRSSYRSKPRTFVVFRQDSEQRIGSYTEDIGDLCIFLGNSEAFCVSATEYPGLHPNSIYYASSSTGFGCYDLSSNTLHHVTEEPPLSSTYMWLAPLQ